MDAAGTNWTMIIIVGAVILVAVIAWAALRSRPGNDDSRDHDGSTKRLYQEEDNAHKGESDNVP